MQVSGTTYYKGLPFEDYLQLPGVSYSSLKDFEGEPNSGMRLGTRVHNYLNEPETYDWKDADAVRAIAQEIRKVAGNVLPYMAAELSFTSIFRHNGMELRYKGRADRMKSGRLLIDFKVLSGSLTSAIERFGYDKQISGYCLATATPLGLIISYNKKIKKVETKAIKPEASFWEYQCVHRGEPI